MDVGVLHEAEEQTRWRRGEAEGDDAWVYVENGANSYFFNRDTEQVSWALPEEIIEGQMRRFDNGGPFPETTDNMGTIAEADEDAEEDAVTAALNRGDDEEHSDDDQSSTSGSDNADVDALTGDRKWVVRLHPDSGQVYYADVLESLSTWNNPFLGESLSEQLDVIDQEHMQNQDTEKQEDLAGFRDAPSRAVFQSEHADWAGKRLDAWMERRNLKVTDEDAVLIKFPVYVNTSRSLPGHKLFRISVVLPPGLSENVRSLMIAIPAAMTVQQLLDQVFTKFQRNEGRVLDEEGTGRYVFKVRSYSDYLLHTTFRLEMYDHIALADRKGKKIELQLLRLTDAELMDLGPLLDMSEEEVQAQEESRHVRHGDDWTEDTAAWDPTQDASLLTTADLTADFTGLPFETSSIVDVTELQWPFRVMVRGVENAPVDIPCDSFQVETGVYFSGEPVSTFGSTARMMGASTDNMCTPEVTFSKEPRFAPNWLTFPVKMSQLPPSTRVGFMLVGRMTTTGQRVPIAGAAISLTDFRGRVIEGKQTIRLWPSKELQVARVGGGKHGDAFKQVNLASGVLGENVDSSSGCMHVIFDSYPLPVVARWPTMDEELAMTLNDMGSSRPAPSRALSMRESKSFTDAANPTQNELRYFEILKRADPLTQLNQEDKTLLWKCREWCTQFPELLPKFLQSVAWLSPSAVAEAHRLIAMWKPLPISQVKNALELLDVKYADPVVREYAVRQLDAMTDEELADFLLQFVQVLKYEPYHDSPLARMLLRRAIRSPLRVGHFFFWMLRSEMHDPCVSERFGTLLIRYVKFAGPHCSHLRRQVYVNSKIKVIADAVKSVAKPDKLSYVREELARLNPELPGKFQLPLSPRIECKSLIVEKCKVMGSKKEPLWLCFENADPTGEPYLAIFKAGDDLRQDQMTLQLLKVMDEIWRQHSSLDLRILPYLCCSTGDELGILEVVKNSDTTAHIQQAYGGKMMGALKSTPIDMFLRTQNKTDSAYSAAVENFVHTCAGYCVATYVMGIGDRHADNIMVTDSGHLFHIDFGHFLGNFKSKFGVKRERAPFVFTPEMAYVMSSEEGPGFNDFERICCQAYNALRDSGSLFINLFTLMVPAGMPELQEKDDITYLREQLSLEMTESQANRKFIGEIKNSLHTVSRRLDNLFHNLKHG